MPYRGSDETKMRPGFCDEAGASAPTLGT
jgi:hypothetical protein